MVCEHEWKPTTVEHWDECARCGSYHNRDAPPTADVYGPDFWKGSPTQSSMEEQVYNVETHTEGGVTKNGYVLSLIDCTPGRVMLEIGCAPGSLLRRLQETYHFATFGNEYRWEYIDQVRKIAGDDHAYIGGPFPASSAGFATGSLDLVIALDVFEHSHDPEAFLAECARLLKTWGQLILMLPFAQPVHLMAPRMFHPTEHVFLPSTAWMGQALVRYGFPRHEWGRWCNGHETVSAWRAAA